MKIIVSLCCLLATGDLTVLAQRTAAGTNIAFVAVEGFSFQVPTGWKQIPHDALLGMLSDMQETVPNMRGGDVSYGFQPSAISAPVGFPRVLVNLKRSSNITDNNLKALGEQMLVIQKKLNKKLEGNTLGVTTTTVEEAKLDENRHLLRVTMRSGLADGSTLQSTLVLFATSEGMLSFLFTVKDSDYRNYAASFEGMLDSVRLGNSLRPTQITNVQSNSDWQQRITDNIVKFIASSVGAFVLIVITFRSIRKRSQSSGDSKK